MVKTTKKLLLTNWIINQQPISFHFIFAYDIIGGLLLDYLKFSFHVTYAGNYLLHVEQFE
jgi:hypothetical protein